MRWSGLPIRAFAPDVEHIIKDLANAVDVGLGRTAPAEAYLRVYADYLRSIYHHANYLARSFTVELRLCNTGTMVAERVVIEVTVPESYRLNQKVPGLPINIKPPELPSVTPEGQLWIPATRRQGSPEPLVVDLPDVPRQTYTRQEMELLHQSVPQSESGNRYWPRIEEYDRTRATYEARAVLHHAPVAVVPFVVAVSSNWNGEPFQVQAHVTATDQAKPTTTSLMVEVVTTCYRDPWILPMRQDHL